MGLLTKEVPEGWTYDQRDTFFRGWLNTGDIVMNARGRTLACLAVLAAGFGVFSNEGLGAWGHGTISKTDAVMNAEARAQYNRALRQASTAELFELRYTDFATVSVARTAIGHSGIVGALETSNILSEPTRQYTVGDGCLNDTAYDINGGQLQFDVRYSGIASTVEANATGNVPTSAAQAIYNPSTHELTIKSGNTHADDLLFGVRGDALQPIGQTTEDVLATYGCKDAVQYTYQNV